MKLQIIFLPTSRLIAKSDSQLTALLRLLAKGNHDIHAEPASAVLCQVMGVTRQTDCPVASISWLGEGEDPGTYYWLYADPVHLMLQRDYFTLEEPLPLALSRQDANSILTTLNQHFAQDGMKFYLGNTGRWYLRLEAPAEIITTTPEAALGLDVGPFLPKGSDASKWNQLLNEMQMLLHTHAINQVRESMGELPANSLWLWGGGALPGHSKTSAKAVFSDHALAKGLARLAQVRYFAVPDNMEAMLLQDDPDVLLVLDDAHEAEQKWFSPLLAALKARQIEQITVHFAVRDQVLSVTVKPADLWKFWRRPQALQNYFMANT